MTTVKKSARRNGSEQPKNTKETLGQRLNSWLIEGFPGATIGVIPEINHNIFPKNFPKELKRSSWASESTIIVGYNRRPAIFRNKIESFFLKILQQPEHPPVANSKGYIDQIEIHQYLYTDNQNELIQVIFCSPHDFNEVTNQVSKIILLTDEAVNHDDLYEVINRKPY